MNQIKDFLLHISLRLTNKYPWIANSLLTLMSIIVITIVFEILLRQTGYEGDYERSQFRFSSPYAVVRKNSWVLKENPSEVSVKSIQIRESLYDFVGNSKQSRYLFIGDSITEGWGVYPNQAFPVVFEKLMDSQGFRIQSINAGVYGLNTFDEYNLFTTRLKKLKPQTLILGLFLANDINFNLLYSERLTNYPTWLLNLWQKMLDESALVHFIYLRLITANQKFGFATGSDDGYHYSSRVSLIDKTSKLHMLHYREGEIAGYLPEEPALITHAYDLLEKVLLRFQSECQLAGIRFTLLIIPAPPAIAGHYYSPIEPMILETLENRGIKLQMSKLDIGKPTRRVLGICDKLHLDCIDATPQLRKLGAKIAILPYDDHLSEAGHAEIARLLLEKFTTKKK